MSKVKVHVEGYGRITVRVPKKLTRRRVTDCIGDAVAQTMQLAHPAPAVRFHPVLGMVER